MPITFLSLPREIRDQIYLETLYTDALTRVGARAEREINTWFAGREHLPGYYRPLLHYHQARGPPTRTKPYFLWSHETRIAPAPALFQVGGGIGSEARELYLKSHILLEMKIVDDCDDVVGEWMGLMDEALVNLIQRLHVYMHVRLFFEGADSDPLIARLRPIRDFDIDLVDPMFRFELRNDATELVVVTAAKIREKAALRIRNDVKAWAKAREHPESRFVGSDLVTVARRVLDAVRFYVKNVHMHLQADIKASDIVHVCEHEGKSDDYGTVLRMSSHYPYVLARVICGEADDNELPEIGLLEVYDGQYELNDR